MRLAQMINYYATHAWAMEPRTLALGRELLRQAVTGRQFTGLDVHAELQTPERDEHVHADAGTRKAAREGGIAVIPIVGMIDVRGSSLGISAESIDTQFSAALASRQVDGILFDFDSPGGVVSGVPDLGEKILAARGMKPMLAMANSGMMASAAYWLGAAADEIWMTQESLIGSIGVWTFHEDISKWLENEGIVITPSSAGKFKLEGAPWEPLSDEAKARQDAMVNDIYRMFLKAVASGRDTTPVTVRDGYGQGRVVMANEALEANLVDKVGTFAEAVARLSKLSNRKAKGPKADTLRRRLELDMEAGVV